MFAPVEFELTDPAAVRRLVGHGFFGTLVTAAAAGFRASAVPVLWAEAAGGSVLRGHLALRNPQAADVLDGARACLTATLAHAYVTPRWYREEPDVPTWNYVVLEGQGMLQALTPKQTIDLLDDSARVFEPQVDAEGPAWRLADFPDPRLAVGLGRAILGFELQLDTFTCTAKLSQDKLQGDVDAVRAALARSQDAGARHVAALMDRLQVRGRAPGSTPSTLPPEAQA